MGTEYQVKCAICNNPVLFPTAADKLVGERVASDYYICHDCLIERKKKKNV